MDADDHGLEGTASDSGMTAGKTYLRGGGPPPDGKVQHPPTDLSS